MSLSIYAYKYTNIHTYTQHTHMQTYTHVHQIHPQPRIETAAQLGQPLDWARGVVRQPTLQHTDSHPCKTHKKKIMRREPVLVKSSLSLSVK